VSKPDVRRELVELVDPSGRAVGTMGKLDAHLAPGHLHRAVSVFLLDQSGRLLVQRRAAGKYHSAGVWSNTCCGHPRPGERPNEAASRRLACELGLAIAPDDLVDAGIVMYETSDAASGLTELEYDHIFVGRTTGQPQLNPAEVAEVTALSLADLAAATTDWSGCTAWFSIVLQAAMPALMSLPQVEAASRLGLSPRPVRTRSGPGVQSQGNPHTPLGI
jgi:isopentenyl-diphosphate delta-isomerase